jgi:hypothetical protein
MTRKANLIVLLVAALATVLAVAGFSHAASTSAPVNTAEPKISGTAQEGQTLVGSSGSWSGSGTIAFKYQWRRCNTQGNGCSNIGGADSSNYQLKSADVGHTVRVRVNAKNADGSASAESNETVVVTPKTAPPPTTVDGCPTSGTGTLDVSAIAPPARLQIDGQAVSPTVIVRTTTDLTVRFHVSACGSRSISNALVYATAVPYSQFSIPPETLTGADGWVTMTMHQDRYFPAAAQQQQLTVFVRARKTGEPLLGGVSTRRLVSFPVHL